MKPARRKTGHLRPPYPKEHRVGHYYPCPACGFLLGANGKTLNQGIIPRHHNCPGQYMNVYEAIEKFQMTKVEILEMLPWSVLMHDSEEGEWAQQGVHRTYSQAKDAAIRVAEQYHCQVAVANTLEVLQLTLELDRPVLRSLPDGCESLDLSLDLRTGERLANGE